MRTLVNTGSSKLANYSRDASRPPPWRRWSTSCRYMAWKTPLAYGLSVYEGARLRQPAHERRASVTAGFAYARSAGSTALGRSHAVGAVGSDLRVGGRAPAPPQPTGGRQGPLRRCAAASGPQTRCLLASFSRYACLSCSLSVPQAASQEPQGVREGRHRRPRGSPEPWGLRRCRLRPGQTSSSIPWPPRRALEELSGAWLALFCCNGRRAGGAVCYGPRASPARCPAARARSDGGPRLPWGPPMR
jgi:hypothetical protein